MTQAGAPWTRAFGTAARAATVALVIAALLIAALSRADAAEPESPLDLSMAKVAVDLERARGDLERATSQLSDAESDVSKATASLNVTVGLLEVNSAERASVVAVLKERGVASYTHAGTASLAALDVDATGRFSSAREYSAAATRVDTDALERLNRERDYLEAEREAKTNERDGAQARREDAARSKERLAATVQDLEARLRFSGAVPVMGVSQLSASRIAAWFHAQGARPSLAPGVTIEDVATLYIEEGAAEGVRGDLAFAQAVVETGAFAVAAGNNYSGIGVCDSCTGGYAFPTPRDGVRAQIQLLRNYADPDSRAARLANPPSPGLYGADPTKAARLFDTFFLKGKAPLWNLMGGGNWATDPVYAPKVVKVYAQMVEYANAHPELP